MSAGSAVPRTGLLRVLLGLAIASTTVHYAHNLFAAEMYPPVPLLFPTPLAYQVGIIVFYPLLTAYALWGYRQYASGRPRRAAWAFIGYAPLGMTSPGHFMGGVPDIPPVFFATIFTDLATGAAMLAFGVWILRRVGARPTGPSPALAG